MKILVLQLARFGDIFLSWPTLRALRRKFPEAEIHFLVRKKFSQAAQGLDIVDQIKVLDTADLLAPIILGQEFEQASLQRLTEWLAPIRGENYSAIYNLSFSPLSSYLTQILADESTIIRGYTRTEDGYLAIPDDTSAYFYAQVGVNKSNRYHLGEVFAAVCEVELQAEDWCAPAQWTGAQAIAEFRERHELGSQPYIAVHVASSQAAKSYPAFKWRAALVRIEREWDGRILLVGAANERTLGDEILSGSGLTRTKSLVGDTSFTELFTLIGGAQLLIGCDSAPVHVAALTATPCVNISFSSVNFWETGPMSRGSRVVYADEPETMPSDRVAGEVISCLGGRASGFPAVRRVDGGPVAYAIEGLPDDDFAWRLIQAIYSGGEFPVVHDDLTVAGMVQLREAVLMALEQIPHIEAGKSRVQASRLLDQVDIAIQSIYRIVPHLRPLIDWFQTERLRIGPLPLPEIVRRTNKTFCDLLAVLNLYLGANERPAEIGV